MPISGYYVPAARIGAEETLGHRNGAKRGPQRADRGYADFRELREGEVQLRRIPIPRTPVNKGKKQKAETHLSLSLPKRDLRCALGEVDYGLLGSIAHLRVGAGSAV